METSFGCVIVIVIKIDVTSSTHTDLDVAQEKRIDVYWNVDENRSLSDSWTGFTKFTILHETPPKRFLWSGKETDKNSNDMTSRSSMARRLDEDWKNRAKSRGTRMGIRETNIRKCQKCEENLFY